MVEFPPSYCPFCGDPLKPAGQYRWTCESCDRSVYQSVVPAASVTVVRGDRALCVQRDIPPARGQWSTPGGHVEPDESPAQAAARELREETGVLTSPIDLRLVDAQKLPTVDQKCMVSVDYAILASKTVGRPTACDEIRDVAWFTVTELDNVETGRPDHAHRRIASALGTL